MYANCKHVSAAQYTDMDAHSDIFSGLLEGMNWSTAHNVSVLPVNSLLSKSVSYFQVISDNQVSLQATQMSLKLNRGNVTWGEGGSKERPCCRS